MKIWSYATVWNEEKMLEFYLRHYSQFCDKMIFFDNESDDRSREIINSYPNTEIISFSTGGTFDDGEHMSLKHGAIAHCVGKCDYAIIGDCDEFIYHPNLIQFLEDHLGKTAVFYPAGFDMASHEFPNKDLQIYDSIKTGVPNPWYSKPILINPNLLEEFEWAGGQHEVYLNCQYGGDIYHVVPESVRPEGEYKGHSWGKWNIMHDLLHIFKKEPLKLLHYKFIGSEYVTERHSMYGKRNSQYNIDNNKGAHYVNTDTFDKTYQEIENLLSNSEKLDI